MGAGTPPQGPQRGSRGLLMFTHSCGKQWTGLGRCHCGNCHETFSGISAFDRHQQWWRPGEACENPAAFGLVPTEHAWGTLWSLPGTPPNRRVAR